MPRPRVIHNPPGSCCKSPRDCFHSVCHIYLHLDARDPKGLPNGVESVNYARWVETRTSTERMEAARRASLPPILRDPMVSTTTKVVIRNPHGYISMAERADLVWIGDTCGISRTKPD